MNMCQLQRETWNNELQDSPRRRHPRNMQDENLAPDPPDSEGSARRVALGRKVRSISSFHEYLTPAAGVTDSK
jgi:hypothetical protein